ncbi:MAG: type 4a pilus biogenesis protein PilO [Bdellovibrionales bacterium]|nr:type 4a pilus biogenesis protein PilO [Bdellovibrionales bacterium]
MLQKLIPALQKLTWNTAAVIVVLYAVYCYFTLDTAQIENLTNGIAGQEKEIVKLKEKVQEAKNFEKEFEGRKKRYQEKVKQLQTLQGALPKQFYLPDLLSDLLREAKQLELEIVQIQPDAKEAAQDLYATLGFNIELRGTFVQMFIFLDRMAHMKRLVDVVSFGVSKDTSRATVTLGGEDGAFASSKMGGGKLAYPGIRSSLRVVTYRYKGSAQ